MVERDCEADCAHDIDTLAAVDMVWKMAYKRHREAGHGGWMEGIQISIFDGFPSFNQQTVSRQEQQQLHSSTSTSDIKQLVLFSGRRVTRQDIDILTSASAIFGCHLPHIDCPEQHQLDRHDVQLGADQIRQVWPLLRIQADGLLVCHLYKAHLWRMPV